MAIDVIVFSQEELDRAVSNGHKSICLCDGSFILPAISGISYTKIGDVTVFSGTDIPVTSVSSYATSYVTSYTTSYVTSYTTSYTTSYVTRYEYEYASSSSYVTSFMTSYVTSFVTSFRTVVQEGGKECIMVNGYGINLI